MSATRVAVMAKAPEAGTVKTRLCPPCTPQQAALLAEASLSDTLGTITRVEGARPVLVLAGAPGAWLPAGIEVVRQREGGLGERLAGAVADLGGPVVIIGMDTPQVTVDDLRTVVDELHRPDVDAVLGPAEDGGYWVIGLDRAVPGVFDGVTMSVAGTHDQQAERLAQLGLRVATTRTLRDVDTFEDAVSVAHECHAGRFAPTVRRVTTELDGGPAP